MTKIEINEWLQDAIIGFLRDRVREHIIPDKYPESKGRHVSTSADTSSSEEVTITWDFNPTPGNWRNRKEGTEVFTVRDALALFLKYGPTNGGVP